MSRAASISQFDRTGFRLRSLPSWLASLIVHLTVLILLVLVQFNAAAAKARRWHRSEFLGSRRRRRIGFGHFRRRAAWRIAAGDRGAADARSAGIEHRSSAITNQQSDRNRRSDIATARDAQPGIGKRRQRTCRATAARASGRARRRRQIDRHRRWFEAGHRLRQNQFLWNRSRRLEVRVRFRSIGKHGLRLLQRGKQQRIRRRAACARRRRNCWPASRN